MSNHSEDNKRIAKNTMLLYGRMGLMMIISFFTARITLEALGVENYGINNVVGGLVSMFSLISSSLTASAGRFITFGLGAGDKERLNRIFSTSVNIHIVLAVIVVLAIETIGIWFLNNKMVIPADRLTAAHWVLQCSVISFVVGLLSTPYNAAIVAHERMDIYAYFSLFDAVSRLAIVFSIKYYGGDKLILLAIISLIPMLIKQFYYWQFCKKNFEECTYHPTWDKAMFKEMTSFAGWNFIGCTAGQMKDQGVNIAINMFHGPAINAARGIAMQINGIIGQFSSTFMMALDPQITKEYASGDFERMHKLIFKGTRLAYYLFLFLSLPIFFEVETILYIWLGQVPEHTILFCRLVIILSLAEIISAKLITAQNANGNIRNYQIVVGGTLLMNFPVSYYLLYLGYMPEITLVVAIVIAQICMCERLFFLRNSVKLPVAKFFYNVYGNVILVTLVSAAIPALCYTSMAPGLKRFFTICVISVITSAISIYCIGCDKGERKLIHRYACKIVAKFFRK